jgi:hypothetical protein
MERAFGTDFSAVRIHEGTRAKEMGALAYTQGTDIHFAPGQYQPQSERGQELLGHELAHVVQQAQGRVQATKQKKGVGMNDDHGLEHEADAMGARAARGEAAGMGASGAEPMQLDGAVIQRMPAWDTLEKSENEVYGVEATNRKKLYGKHDAAAPSPTGLYAAATEDKDGATYQVWTPNVSFTSKSDQAAVGARAQRAQILMEDPETTEIGRMRMQEANQFVDALERTVRDRMDGAHGAPTMGVVGPNDCRGWATQLRYLIAKQLQADQLQAGGEQTNFDLDDGNEAAPMQRGDQMTHTFRGVSGACSYHSATVVATDQPSVVTLEAHASKDLTAPDFHVREGLPGFVRDNDTRADGGGSHGLGKTGQRYDVTKSDASATRELGQIDRLLQAYDGQDPLMLLQIIQKFKTLR